MSNVTADYSQYEDEAPSSDKLGILSNLATLGAQLQAKIDEHEKALEELRKQHRDVTERLIPEIMAELKLSEFKTESGIIVAVKEIVRASIPKARNEEAVAWFDENGNSGMVKRRFVIAFSREEQAWANKFAADLRRRKRELDMKEEHKIEPQTLVAFVRKRLEAGEEVPMDLLGVFVQKIAVVGA